jgi:phosphate:Na+ symporter
MGLGMLFFGLQLMVRGLGPMDEVPAVRALLPWLAAEGYGGVLLCGLIGCLLTFILQSSAGVLGLVIALAMAGLVSLPAAGAMVVGLNVGTTLTAALASVGATTAGRRAGWAHVLFNLFGAAWAIALAPWVLIGPLEAVAGNGGDAATRAGAMAGTGAATAVLSIAAVHTAFNLVNTAILLPAVRPCARLLERLVPETEPRETPHRSRLDVRVVESPIIGIEQSRGEILRMAEGVNQMYEWTRQVLDQDEPDPSLIRRIFHREQSMDTMQQEIADFLTDLLTGSVPHSVTEEGRSQLRIADEYESISDYISTVLKSHLRLRNAGLRLADAERAQITELHGRVGSYLASVTEAVRRSDDRAVEQAYRQGRAITARFKELRSEHLSQLGQTRIDPVQSMSYNTMLTAYRKIKDHALNIAEALAGQK